MKRLAAITALAVTVLVIVLCCDQIGHLASIGAILFTSGLAGGYCIGQK